MGLEPWRADAAVDEDDVVQMAFLAFCRRVEAGGYPDLAGCSAVWQLLMTCVEHAAVDVLRRGARQKRGGGKRKPSGAVDSAEDARIGGGGLGKPGQDVAADPECLEQLLLLDRLAKSDRPLWRILLWKWRRLSNAEIAGRLHCSLATLKRRLADIRAVVGQQQRPESD